MSNPLLAKIKLPGRVFQLPSKGLFYGEGVLSPECKDGEVHVHPMSALAEMKMRSADLLYSGKVLNEICRECIPEILNANLLCTQDVDAVFAFLRVVTYGAEVKLHSAHDCDHAKTHVYPVNIEPLLQNPRNKILEHRDSLYNIALSFGYTVKCKPATFSESLELVYMKQAMVELENEGKKPTDKAIEDFALADIMAAIEHVSVDGTIISDRAHIREWVSKLSRPQLNEIIDGAGRTSEWGFEFKTRLKCNDCGKEYDHTLDLNPINFFFG